jgi:hypothetical protein
MYTSLDRSQSLRTCAVPAYNICRAWNMVMEFGPRSRMLRRQILELHAHAVQGGDAVGCDVLTPMSAWRVA